MEQDHEWLLRAGAVKKTFARPQSKADTMTTDDNVSDTMVRLTL